MNAGQLISFVETFLRADGGQNIKLPNTALLLDLLNRGQDEASAETGLPTKLVTVTNQSSPFNLPSDARASDPILEIRYAPNDEDTYVLPLLSIERAGLEYPNWQQDTVTDDPQIAIYAPGTDSLADVYVYPDPGSANYFVLYKVDPAEMTSLASEPFSGLLDRFHIMLAHYATFMLNGNDQRFAIYRNFLDKMAGVRNRGPLVRKNLAYRMRGQYYS